LALANAQRLAGDNAGSRATLVAAQRQSPIRDASIGMRLGASLLEAGAPREAAAIFTRVMRLAPDDPAPIGALAGARRAAGDPAAAWTLIEQARAMAPDRPEFLLTAAQIRHELADIAGALTLLTRADAIRPHHAATQLQRAYSTLITGATHAGWALHEARPLPVPATNARAWTGQLLDQQSIVVTAEQGVGDQFQFARFIAPLAARVPSRVVVECHADAVSLFAASGFDAVARGAAPETEWHVPMLSLPHRLGLDKDVLPSAVPYLHAAPPDHGSKPDTRIVPLAPRGQRGLGVVWAGNPAFTGRATRDFDVSLLSSLLDVDGVQWFSLQFGDDHVAGSAGFERLARVPLSREWLQTASVLRQLDGLVTTDTGDRPPRGGDGHSVLGAAAARARLAMGPHGHHHTVVSNGATGTAGTSGRLGRCGLGVASRARDVCRGARDVTDRTTSARAATHPARLRLFADTFPGTDSVTSEASPPALWFAILTYNALAYTKRCLASLDRTTPEPWHAVILDNGSVDGTREWLAALDNPRLSIELGDNNRGVAGGRNRLLELIGDQVPADGFIVFIDNDLEFFDGWLAPFRTLFARESRAGMASCVGFEMVVHGAHRELISYPGLVQMPVDVASGGFCLFCEASRLSRHRTLR
jgi:hypothetical protein